MLTCMGVGISDNLFEGIACDVAQEVSNFDCSQGCGGGSAICEQRY